MDEPVPCYPALEPPVGVMLTTMPPHPCVYLPNRDATLRAFAARHMPDLVYHDFLNASFRRSGLVIYQPVCQGCQACRPLRVLVERFHPSKSQRRCWRRNQDLIVSTGQPSATDEKFELYARYQQQRHGSTKDDNRSSFEDFLYRSPVQTLEFVYRDDRGTLLAVGICDVCPKSISSVYFFFEPSQSRRGLGTFGALCEIDLASRREIPYYYLGYWVKDCRKMVYKTDFKPYEILAADGCWHGNED
ncbi:MAG TPA: arginyltransferase [Tepidisphaeraceae bacterium]|jgi:arginine-tRNA-protein transferase|nr:arginyltransferase [Tepidisphaeraceae bacterium]